MRIDLLVYLGGDSILNDDASRPANVGRIVNITGHGSLLLGYDLFLKGDNIQGASNHRLDVRALPPADVRGNGGTAGTQHRRSQPGCPVPMRAC